MVNTLRDPGRIWSLLRYCPVQAPVDAHASATAFGAKAKALVVAARREAPATQELDAALREIAAATQKVEDLIRHRTPDFACRGAACTCGRHR